MLRFFETCQSMAAAAAVMAAVATTMSSLSTSVLIPQTTRLFICYFSCWLVVPHQSAGINIIYFSTELDMFRDLIG